MTTDCWACGSPGREVIEGKQYRCDPCDVTWDPRNLPATPRPTADTSYACGGRYVTVPYLDHGAEHRPAP